MKQLLYILLTILPLTAVEIVNPVQDHIYKVGEKVLDFKLLSQYERAYALSDKTQYIFITYDKLSTRLQNIFITQRPHFLEYTQSMLIVDTSVIPGAIFTLFVNPKMRRIPLPLLYSDDINFSKMFPYKENHISIVKLQDKIVKKIVYIKSEEELKELFQVQ